MTHILTLDAGTSGLKCSLFDESGELLGARVATYPTHYPKEGYAEQNCGDIALAAIEAVKSLGETVSLKNVACIGLTGTMNGCIPLDKHANALYPNMIHLDTRAVNEARALEDTMGLMGYYRLSGNRPDVHYGLVKLMWLKANAPEVYKNTAYAVNTKDFLYGFLTGIWGRTDYSDASLFGCMNIHTRAWDSDIISCAEIDKNKLPELFPSTDISGRLSPESANILGLTPGIPVSIGAGDGPATTHGSGVYDASGAYLTVGSSGWAAALSKTPLIDKNARIFNYTDIDENLVTVCGTVQCAATALDYMLKNVLDITLPSGEIDFERAESMCLASPPGANGLYFVPTLMGERCPWWDPKARGVLMGLTLTHTRDDMVRAAYEGVAQEMRLCVSALRENGIAAKNLILSGGGMKSNIFRLILPSVLNAETRLQTNSRQTTSLGAAIAAGVGAGVWKGFKEASEAVKKSEKYLPDPATVKKYELQAQVFEKLYPLTRDAMHLCAE